MGVVAGFATAVAALGIPARAANEPPRPIDTITEVDPSSLPTVSVDPHVAGLSASLASPAGAQELAATLAFNLEVEQEALRTRDASLLPAVDHGDRLSSLRKVIDGIRPGDPLVVPTYEFHSLHLIVVFPGGPQTGANAGLVATATETDITYTADGTERSRAQRPVELTFAMRRVVSNHWLITTTLPAPG